MAKDGLEIIIEGLRCEQAKVEQELVEFEKLEAQAEKLQLKLAAKPDAVRRLASIKSSISQLSGEKRKRRTRAEIAADVAADAAGSEQ